jgi:superfamily II DNA/RNA helicase
MNQSLRIEALKNFKDKSAKILIASDVAARGIDIDGLSHVFNFDVPNNPEDYVHRIGRTGRAGKKGKAYTLYDDNDNKTIISIEKLINKKVNKTSIPIKSKNKSKNNNFFLPDENYLNFKASGKIPDFLNTK